MKIKIRRAEEKDLPKLVKINAEVSMVGRTTTLTKLRKTFRTHQPPKGYFVVAEDGKKIVGWGAAETRRVWYIHHLYITKKYQRKGGGTLLLKKMEAQGRKMKKKQVWLKTQTKNWRAVQFYSRHGYKITGIIKNKWGKGKDAFVMKKSLAKRASK
jgi:ribosomal protein S18 acetylase RimI-like enzyme